MGVQVVGTLQSRVIKLERDLARAQEAGSLTALDTMTFFLARMSTNANICVHCMMTASYYQGWLPIIKLLVVSAVPAVACSSSALLAVAYDRRKEGSRMLLTILSIMVDQHHQLPAATAPPPLPASCYWYCYSFCCGCCSSQSSSQYVILPLFPIAPLQRKIGGLSMYIPNVRFPHQGIHNFRILQKSSDPKS